MNGTPNSTPSRSTPSKSKALQTKSFTLNQKTPAAACAPKPSGRSTQKDKAQPGIPVPEPKPLKTISIDDTELPLLDFGLKGNILLDVTFSNTGCRRSILNLDSGQAPRFSNSANTSKTVPGERVIYRVRLDVIKKASKYFERLLTDVRFAEAKIINSGLSGLQFKGINPEDAQPSELPLISITEDADATLISNRSGVFSDLIRILHGQDATSKLSMPYLAILAVMADRFDCSSLVGRYARGSRRMPWPQTTGQQTFATEETARMKVLVSWYLEDAVKFAASTKELVMRGSLRWAGREEGDMLGVWWDLPDGLEGLLISFLPFTSLSIVSLQSCKSPLLSCLLHSILSFPLLVDNG